ncbi:bifunctional DNA primase/polymerase [Gemmata sp. JC717]|uniref:bifunctional DNA primase/polymerase n=1 Tax=Gemmata algarum TaxID=2975278 RepID=UPI0021BB5BAC|nr:bifunctional DNA primase/polymerase [Gemmata algarum]MDY3555972.1 bifunctional DNA primase/polymerase [Gemmata algarum]
MLDSALALARKGFRIFPLAKKSKVPIFTQPFQRATRDPETITAWWNVRYHNCNIGVSLPGVLVIDIDGEVGEGSFARLRASHPCPPTAEVRSGGGRHLYYRLPPGTRAIPRPVDFVAGFEAHDKIDIKGSGGLVVGPGSVHKSGSTYEWVTEPATIEDLTSAPAWMLHDLCGPEEPKYLIELGREVEEYPDPGSDDELVPYLLQAFPVHPGARHAQTGRAACWLLGHGVSQEKAHGLLERWLLAHGRDDDAAHSDLVRTLDKVYAKLRAGDGSVYLMTDHEQAAVDYHHQKQGGGRALNAFSALPHTDKASEYEVRFLHALLVHVLYQAKCGHRLKEIPMTHRQLMRTYELLHPGQKLNWKSLEGLLKKYVTRGCKRATKLEVLVMEVKGRVREASVYRVALPGLVASRQAIEEANNANHVRPDVRPGAGA